MLVRVCCMLVVFAALFGLCLSHAEDAKSAKIPTMRQGAIRSLGEIGDHTFLLKFVDSKPKSILCFDLASDKTEMNPEETALPDWVTDIRPGRNGYIVRGGNKYAILAFSGKLTTGKVATVKGADVVDVNENGWIAEATGKEAIIRNEVGEIKYKFTAGSVISDLLLIGNSIVLWRWQSEIGEWFGIDLAHETRSDRPIGYDKFRVLADNIVLGYGARIEVTIDEPNWNWKLSYERPISDPRKVEFEYWGEQDFWQLQYYAIRNKFVLSMYKFKNEESLLSMPVEYFKNYFPFHKSIRSSEFHRLALSPSTFVPLIIGNKVYMFDCTANRLCRYGDVGNAAGQSCNSLPLKMMQNLVVAPEKPGKWQVAFCDGTLATVENENGACSAQKLERIDLGENLHYTTPGEDGLLLHGVSTCTYATGTHKGRIVGKFAPEVNHRDFLQQCFGKLGMYYINDYNKSVTDGYTYNVYRGEANKLYVEDMKFDKALVRTTRLDVELPLKSEGFCGPYMIKDGSIVLVRNRDRFPADREVYVLKPDSVNFKKQMHRAEKKIQDAVAARSLPVSFIPLMSDELLEVYDVENSVTYKVDIDEDILYFHMCYGNKSGSETITLTPVFDEVRSESFLLQISRSTGGGLEFEYVVVDRPVHTGYYDSNAAYVFSDLGRVVILPKPEIVKLAVKKVYE